MHERVEKMLQEIKGVYETRFEQFSPNEIIMILTDKEGEDVFHSEHVDSKEKAIRQTYAWFQKNSPAKT